MSGIRAQPGATPTLLLWAGEAHAAPAQDNMVLWHGTHEGSGIRSLRDVAERHADEVRRRYLAWCYDFAETTIAGRRLREHFSFADGSSLWNQSVFVEQSAWRQRSLEAILKLTALELLLEHERPARVRFAGGDRELADTLRQVCRWHGVDFEWARLPRKRRHLRAGRLLRALPQILQGLLMLLYMLPPRLRLRPPTANLPSGTRACRSVLIAGPFFNFDVNAAAGAGTFTSRFWTVLPAMLKEHGLHVTWLQTFYKHAEIRTLAAAAQVLSRINGSTDARETHLLLDAYLTARGAVRIVSRWFKSASQSWLVGHVLEQQQRHERVLRYWPVLRLDWARAFRGVHCVEGLLYAECYDRALRTLLHQDEGLYLMESQGWERALAAAWRRHGHGRLAGVVHSTIRFWDLRYHSDPRHYGTGAVRSAPVPDVVVLNGRAARAAYLSTAASREALADCEALRYLHLGEPQRRKRAVDPRTMRILVVGDFTTAGTAAVLTLLEMARTRSRLVLEVHVKPHPNVPVQAADYPGLELVVLGTPVGEQAREADVVLAANLTSAAVDAYASGAPVLIYDDGVNFNYSPLRGMPGATFVRTADDLCDALHAVNACAESAAVANEPFFNIDSALPGWRRYLSERLNREPRVSPEDGLGDAVGYFARPRS